MSAGILIEAPRLGRSLAFSQRDASFVLGDPLVATVIGWDSGKFHWSIGATANIPAGGYQEGELSNLAFNRWIGDVYAAVTWLDPELGLDLSGAVGFEFNGENPETDYRSGNAFHVDVSISKHLTKEFSIGLLAGYFDQVSGDGGAGNRVGPFKGRVTAVGATAGYDFTVAGTPVSTASGCYARSTSRTALRAPSACSQWAFLWALRHSRRRSQSPHDTDPDRGFRAVMS